MNTEEAGHNGRPESGFTLLELLISITMICLVLMIAGSAVRLSMRSVASGDRRMEAIDRFSSALNIVDAQIQSQLPVGRPDVTDTNPLFQGDGESMQFVSIFSIWGYQKGCVTVAYKVVQDRFGKEDLSAEESAIGAESGGEVKLFEYFDRIYFDYYYKDPAAEQGSWIDKWEDANSVPEKIRLHLVTGNSEISLIIPVKVKALQNRPVTSAPNA